MSCLEPGNRFLCPSQDLAAIPDFESGAMENWGLTTYRESSLLFDAEKSSASDKLGITMTVSHELAHQVHKVNHAFKNCGEATYVCVGFMGQKRLFIFRYELDRFFSYGKKAK